MVMFRMPTSFRADQYHNLTTPNYANNTRLHMHSNWVHTHPQHKYQEEEEGKVWNMKSVIPL